MDVSALTIAVDHTDVDVTTEAFDRLADSIARVNSALLSLGEEKHGGISIRIVGTLADVQIAPAP